MAQQSVKYATTAGSANAVAWGNVSGKPSAYVPSAHTHDDRYYTETEANNLLGGRARIVRTTWGKSITIPNLPHGFVFLGEYALYLIWTAGNPGAYQINKALLHGGDVLNISLNASNGTVTVSLKDMTLNGGIIYIGA